MRLRGDQPGGSGRLPGAPGPPCAWTGPKAGGPAAPVPDGIPDGIPDGDAMSGTADDTGPCPKGIPLAAAPPPIGCWPMSAKVFGSRLPLMISDLSSCNGMLSSSAFDSSLV